MEAFDHFSLETSQLLTHLGLPASMYFLAQTRPSAISVDTQGSTCTPAMGPTGRVTPGADVPVAQSSTTPAVPQAGVSPVLSCPRRSCCRPCPRSSSQSTWPEPAGSKAKLCRQAGGTSPTNSRRWAGLGKGPCSCWLFITLRHQAHDCQGKGGNLQSKPHRAEHLSLLETKTAFTLREAGITAPKAEVSLMER